MAKHVLRQIDQLKGRIIAVASKAETGFLQAIKATVERDATLARTVIDGDEEIDQLEVDVEEECLKLLALYQPVATDLRFIVSVLKINNDLERVGDLAVNIAERAVFLTGEEALPVGIDFDRMARLTRGMLAQSIEALVAADTDRARRVIAADDEVDRMNREIYEQVKANMRRRPEAIERLIHYLAIARHLERIADHATNIAEDVIYMVEGEIVRHKPEDYGTVRP
jgi:phosphate transport system protein